MYHDKPPQIPFNIADLPRLPLIGAIAEAFWFARGAHAATGATRKNGSPYFTHVGEVARIASWGATVSRAFETDWMDIVCIGLCHDLIEDTKITRDTLARMFGGEIADGVQEITHVSKPSDGIRAQRRKLDREHDWKAGHKAQTVRAADVISNLKDVEELNHDFLRVYVSEKRLLLPGLTRAPAVLLAQAWHMVEDLEARYGRHEG